MKANNISSIEFQKSQKKGSAKKETGTSGRSRTTIKSRPNRNMQSSNSTVNIPSHNENSNIHTKRNEEKNESIRDRTVLNSKNYNSSSKILGGSQEKANLKKHKSFYEHSAYADRIRSRKSPKAKEESDYMSEKSEPHLSAYAEEYSVQSSAISHTSKYKHQTPIPPITHLKENNMLNDEEEAKELGIEAFEEKETEIKDEKMIEYDDFTDKQKGYISNLLEEKLTLQRERMLNHFQNMQIEMVRQFQIQYLEIAETIEKAVENKKKREFFDKY